MGVCVCEKNTITVLLANVLNLTKINIISSAEGSYGECWWGGVTSMIKMTSRRCENALALTTDRFKPLHRFDFMCSIAFKMKV